MHILLNELLCGGVLCGVFESCPFHFLVFVMEWRCVTVDVSSTPICCLQQKKRERGTATSLFT